LLVVAIPLSLLGQTPSAILHTQGGVWVNGYEARDSSAVFTGDLVETKPGFSASLSLEGSTVLIQPESVAKLQDNMLVLDHGGVSVTTSRSYKVRVNCLTVVPVSNDWTQYDVADVNATAQVAARKGDVYVERETDHRKPAPETAAPSREGTVHEGEQRSYDESELCGAPPRPTGAGPALNSKWIIAGAAGIGILVCVFACRPGPGPISASKP
jgi:ribosomal 50S subunit-recycling heat shock protein